MFKTISQLEETGFEMSAIELMAWQNDCDPVIMAALLACATDTRTAMDLKRSPTEAEENMVHAAAIEYLASGDFQRSENGLYKWDGCYTDLIHTSYEA